MVKKRWLPVRSVANFPEGVNKVSIYLSRSVFIKQTSVDWTSGPIHRAVRHASRGLRKLSNTGLPRWMSAILELRSQRPSCRARLYLIAAKRYIVLLCPKTYIHGDFPNRY